MLVAFASGKYQKLCSFITILTVRDLVNLFFSTTEIQLTNFMFNILTGGSFFSYWNKSLNQYPDLLKTCTHGLESLKTSTVYFHFLAFKSMVKFLENNVHHLVDILCWTIRKSHFCRSQMVKYWQFHVVQHKKIK